MASTRLLAIAVTGAVALVGCGTSSGTGSTSSATTSAATPTTGSSSIGTSSSTTSRSTTSSSTTSPATAENLHVTNGIRAELLQAGASMNGLPASAYTGLVPGKTYYGYDPVTATYWAGAALVPSHTSIRAQVSVQDDGSYILFSRTDATAWKARPVGLAGIAGTACPTAVPASVLTVWHWAPGSCRPAA